MFQLLELVEAVVLGSVPTHNGLVPAQGRSFQSLGEETPEKYANGHVWWCRGESRVAIIDGNVLGPDRNRMK